MLLLTFELLLMVLRYVYVSFKQVTGGWASHGPVTVLTSLPVPADATVMSNWC